MHLLEPNLLDSSLTLCDFFADLWAGGGRVGDEARHEPLSNLIDSLSEFLCRAIPATPAGWARLAIMGWHLVQLAASGDALGFEFSFVRVNRFFVRKPADNKERSV